jgi:nucleotidyltransferase/DNA polymerase involved in DNA repair
MEHDERCENQKIVEWFWHKYESDERLTPMLNAMTRNGGFCACTARAWGITMNLRVGLAIAEKKALRFVAPWMETLQAVGQEQRDTLQDFRVRQMVERWSGANVIDIRKGRDARSLDDA